MSIEIIIATLIFFGVLTTDQASNITDQDAKSYYEQNDLDQRSIEDWESKRD